MHCSYITCTVITWNSKNLLCSLHKNFCGYYQKQHFTIFASHAGAVAKYCDEYVCLWACLSVCLSVDEDILGTTCAIFTNFFVHVACVHGSVLLWHVYDCPHRVSPGRGFLPRWKCIISRERGMGVHSTGEVSYLRLPCFVCFIYRSVFYECNVLTQFGKGKREWRRA